LNVYGVHRNRKRRSGSKMEKAEIKKLLKKQRIETPSWGYADSGTRFNVFSQAAAARTLEEKLEDASQVNT
jgi:L-rhamnose isomerase/sugar isomerase